MELDLVATLSNSEFTQKDKALVLLAYEKEREKQPKDLKHIAINFGLKEAQKWNFSQLLGNAKGLAVKLPGGWILTRKGEEYLQEMGLYIQTNKSEQNSSSESENMERLQVCPVFGIPRANLKKEWADVFMIMPFREELNPIYTDHIRKVADEIGVTCERGDDFFSSQAIIDEIWAAIYFSKVCIADCTGRNPNVFYELGMAHAIGKTVIPIAQSIDDIPFDIRHRRSIIYEYTPRGMSTFEDLLKKTLQNELLSV